MSMALSRRRLLGSTALGLALAACGRRSPAAEGGRPVTLMLDWYPNADHAGIYAALDQGYFAAHGMDIQVQTPSDTTEQIPLVASGGATFAVSYEPDLLLARAQGIPVEAVFALVQEPLNCLIAPQSSGVTHPAQLQGKKVGTSGTPGDTAILDSLVRADGGDPAKVVNVNVGQNLVPALLGHKVDAIVGGYWNWEAVELAQQGMPVNVVHLEKWGVPTYDELVIVAAHGTVTGSPSVVRDFAAALAQGTSYAKAHMAQSLQQILKANPSLAKGLVQKSLQLLQPAWEAGSGRPGYMDPTAWQAYGAWMLREKWLSTAVDTGQAMTDAFVPKG